MYGQEAGSNNIQRVLQDMVLWDTFRLGGDVPTNVPGWYTTFANLLNEGNTIHFFNQRQESEAHTAYTNMKKKTGLDWPIYITSIGIGFYYPDPVNVDLFDGDRTASKVWCDLIPKHCSCSVYTGGADDKILSFRPEHAPYGFGSSGNMTGPGESFASIITNGIPDAGNRFLFPTQKIPLPKDTALQIDLTFEKPARDAMELMVAPNPIAFAQGNLTNECGIVVCIRGQREVQQLGNYTR